MNTFPEEIVVVPAEKIMLEVHASGAYMRDREGFRSISDDPSVAIDKLIQWAAERGVEVTRV